MRLTRTPYSVAGLPLLLLVLLLAAAAATGARAAANLDEDDWVFDDEEEDGDAEAADEHEPELSPDDKLLAGARGDDIVMVKEALAEGADPNLTMQDETKWSVLMLSLYRAQVGRWVGPAGAEYRSTGAEVARVLIEAGAAIEYRRPIPGGGTALSYAAEWGRLAAINMLIEMGAEVDARSHGKKVEEEKKKGRKNRKKKKVKMGGNTPLMAVRATSPPLLSIPHLNYGFCIIFAVWTSMSNASVIQPKLRAENLTLLCMLHRHRGLGTCQ
jgi:hypothetical protein